MHCTNLSTTPLTQVDVHILDIALDSIDGSFGSLKYQLKTPMHLNYLMCSRSPNDKFLSVQIESNFNVALMEQFFLDRVENIVWKGQGADY